MQQRERGTLSRVVKRRTVATCSRPSSEHEALETVLTSFLSTRSSRRRQPSSSRSPADALGEKHPLAESSHIGIALDSSACMDKNDTSLLCQEQDQSFQVTFEIPPQTDQNEISHTEEQNKSCLMSQDSPEEKCFNAERCCGMNVHCSSAGPKRTPCIEDKATPKISRTSRRRSVFLRLNGGQKTEQAKNEKAHQTLEGCRKTPCQVGYPASDAIDVPGISSPHPRGIQPVDFALQDSFGSPWTVLSPHVSPSYMRRRRYSFSSAPDEELDDGLWALPDTPSKGPLLAPMCRFYEHSVSTSVISHVGVGSSPLKQGTLLRSASVGEKPESIPSFRFGAFFPRRHGKETRKEPSALMSFFQRFGERGRPASVGGSCRGDT